MTLLEALKEIKRRLDCRQELPYPNNGICKNASYFSGGFMYDIIDTVGDISEKWDKYSGLRSFPVEGCYGIYYHNTQKWNKSTHYGNLRHELLTFLIAELEKGE